MRTLLTQKETYLKCIQRFTSHVRRFYRLPVEEGSAVFSRGEELSHQRIVYYPDLGLLVHQQRKRDARVRETMDEICGTVYRVNDPRRIVCQLR